MKQIEILDEQTKTSGDDWMRSVIIYCIDGRLFKSVVLIGTSGANASLEHMTLNGDWEMDTYQDGFSQTELTPTYHGGNLTKQIDSKHEEFKIEAKKLSAYLPKTKEE